MAIKTVGVVGTGVIGASWTGLFLSRGLKVFVSDPGPGAEEKLAAYLQSIWPDLEKIGLAPGASLDNYKFVGPSLKGYYDQVEFIQEVRSSALLFVVLLMISVRMRLRERI